MFITSDTIMISIHALLAESNGGPGGQNAVILHFYPRSPCGERRNTGSAAMVPPTISIHALLAESDLSYYFRKYLFLISIHALLAESDALRSPRIALMVGFLSTLSLRRATQYQHDRGRGWLHFYPRSPCGERLPTFCIFHQPTDFYPRSPCGERRRRLW